MPKFTELPICELCNNLYDLRNRKPFLLPCKHTYCEVCIEDMLRNGINYCPKDMIRMSNDSNYVFSNENINSELVETTHHVYPREYSMSKNQEEIFLLKTEGSIELENTKAEIRIRREKYS